MKALGNSIKYSGAVELRSVNSESMALGQGSGESVLGAWCWVLGGFWVLGVGCGVASSGLRVTGFGFRVTSLWVLGTGCWVLGETCLMLEIDSWFSSFVETTADKSVFVVTVPDEEDCWVSTFVETSEDEAERWVAVFLMLESCFCHLPSAFSLPASGF